MQHEAQVCQDQGARGQVHLEAGPLPWEGFTLQSTDPTLQCAKPCRTLPRLQLASKTGVGGGRDETPHFNQGS